MVAAVKSPVLALDVDGVLNALVRHQREAVCVLIKPEWATPLTNPEVVGTEVELHIDRERDRRFLAAVEGLGVDIVWCTTWEGAANEVIGPLYGLGPRDVLAVSEFNTGLREPVEAKAAAIDCHFPDRRVLMLDDDAWRIRHVWSQRLDRRIVAPSARWGLRREDREQVVGWFLTQGRARDVLRAAGVPDGRPRDVRVLGASG